MKKFPGAIKSNQNAWLKLIIDTNTDLIKKAKSDSHKFKLINNTVFRKTMKNVRKHRDINFIDKKKLYL